MGRNPFAGLGVERGEECRVVEVMNTNDRVAERESPSRPLCPFPNPPLHYWDESHLPVATWSMLAINVLVWLLMTLSGGSDDPRVLIRFGAKVNPLIASGEFWRLLTPIFIHVGFAHLAFNSYALYVVGPQVERSFGTFRFLLLYLLSGVYGVLFSFAFNPHISAGASGAIFGLIGAQAVFFYSYSDVCGSEGRRRLYVSLSAIVLILLLTFLSSDVDIWGHLGGLLAGAALGGGMMPRYVVMPPGSGSTVLDRNPPRHWGLVIALAVAFLAFGVWGAMFLQG